MCKLNLARLAENSIVYNDIKALNIVKISQ